MRKDEKEVLQHQLDSEKAILKELEKQYKAALEAIDEKVAALLGRSDANLQHVIFQIEHQKALRRQIEGVLNQLHSNEFDTISDYLANCYEDGFIGSMYSMHHQGIPVIVPIDQNEVTKAVVLDSKINEGLYESIGVDVDKMKKSIRSEITRGISAGMSYNEIARNISKATSAPLSRAKTIVYTEGHRVQQASNYDGQRKAKSKGADVVKQWNSILDGNTRPTHRKLDGQIREVEEPFEMDGKKAMYPGEFGDPAEDCNCRCVSMTRARWALDEEELQTLKDRAEYFGLLEEKKQTFEEYRQKYLAATQALEFQQQGGKAKPPKAYDGVFDDFAELQLSKEEQDALVQLQKLAISSGYEYGSVISNGKVSQHVTSGLPNAVKIPLDDFSGNVTVIHSHTNATPPSATDFFRLLDERVEKIGVIGYNGDAYMAYIGDGDFPSVDELQSVARDIAREVDADMLDNPEFFDWSVDERNYMCIREQAYRIARYFNWTLEGGRINDK